ncbi:MAG TPA: cobyric acid synthase [Stellaceae bacterium]|nr:cobyric acid synthase [Stellaceae bacterium]
MILHPRRTPSLMLQGTGSDVGKSLLVAGLARALTRRGLRVRPFKPQNMSNNAAVTAEGGEIGRAQALQARACGVPPSADMNPVLLKPQSERGAQVVVEGRVLGAASARDYHALKPSLLPRVLASFDRLSAAADIVLVEGAGSAAEINLRDGDIANMGFAEAADVPVVLVGDIDRGGVLAAIAGTVGLLEPRERARLRGYIVNKFRGDPRLFDNALDILHRRTGLDCLGIVPFFPAAHALPAEDAMALDRAYPPPNPPPRGGRASFSPSPSRGEGGEGVSPRHIRIVVPRLPRIANFDDLDPLAAEPHVALELVPPGRPLPLADLVLLPGSKATLADLAELRRNGWDIDILAHARRGGAVLGLCAGYQMLGRRIADPDGIEGSAGAAPGLGLLDVETVLGREKLLVEASGVERASGAPVRGYEMHLGRTAGPDTARPMLRLGDRSDGAVSEDGRIAGCHLHGLFAGDVFRRAFLARLGGAGDSALDYERRVETTLDALAAHLERSLDIPRLLEIAHAR